MIKSTMILGFATSAYRLPTPDTPHKPTPVCRHSLKIRLTDTGPQYISDSRRPPVEFIRLFLPKPRFFTQCNHS